MKPSNLHSLASLAARINAAHQTVMSVKDDARRAGELLLEVKRRVGHGAFLPWVRENCPNIAVRTVQQYMRLARLCAAGQIRTLAHLRGGGVEAETCPTCGRGGWRPVAALQPHEIRELRRMLTEMETFPFQRRTFNYDAIGRGSSPEIVAGAGGAPVFHDIMGGRRGTRRQVIVAINRVLQRRRPTALGARVLDVMRRRIDGDPSLSKPWLPPEAGADEYDVAELEAAG